MIVLCVCALALLLVALTLVIATVSRLQVIVPCVKRPDFGMLDVCVLQFELQFSKLQEDYHDGLPDLCIPRHAFGVACSSSTAHSCPSTSLHLRQCDSVSFIVELVSFCDCLLSAQFFVITDTNPPRVNVSPSCVSTPGFPYFSLSHPHINSI